MAHELEIKEGKASMFYKGELPWHSLGTEIKEAITAEEAIKLANLDWKVAKVPVLYNFEGKVITAKDKFVTVRTDTGASLGTVGSSYVPLQNNESFGFFDAVVGEGEAIYETGGILFGGRKIWLAAKMPKHITLKGGDEVIPYVILANSHDGSGSTQAFLSNKRPVCSNTLGAALNMATHRVNVRHTTNMVVNLKEAHKILGLRNECTEALREAYNLLQKKKVNTKFMDEFLSQLYPKNEDTLVRTNADKIKEEIIYSFENGEGHELLSSNGTAWGAYNAVTAQIGHMREYKTQDNKLNSLWFGSGARIDQKAFDILLKMSKN